MAFIDTVEIPGPVMHVTKNGDKVVVQIEYDAAAKERFLAMQKLGWEIIKVVSHKHEVANFTATMIFMGKPGS